MRVIVTSELHYFEARDGSVWAPGAFHVKYWRMYLDIFSDLKIIARVKRLNKKIPKSFIRIDTNNISFIKVPDFYGPFEFLAKYFQIRKILSENIQNNCAYCFQAPGTLTNLVITMIKNHPYGLNVIGDPYDVFSPGANKNIFRWYFRSLFKNNLEKQCLSSVSSSYVTGRALQKRYPGGENTFSLGVSDVIINSSQIKKNPSKFINQKKRRLIYIGTLNQLYKAPEVLIKSLKICHDAGYKYKLKIIGDGKFKNYLIKLTKKLNLSKDIYFLGQINDFKQIFNHLDQSDLFVLPSRSEGMPRALLEAMVRGLPAVASNVGGIPEILSADVLVRPNDPKMLAKKIIEIASSAELLSKYSAINLQTIKKFDHKLLQKKKDKVLRVLKRKTAEYLDRIPKTI